MRWLVAPAFLCCALFIAPTAARATAPPGGGDQSTTTVAGSPVLDTVPIVTAVPGAVASETGAPVAPPAELASAPLLQTPKGCPSPPVASVVFVGRVVVKDYRVARFQIDQVRAGSTEGYVLGELVDVRYGNDVEFLDTNELYLVGAVPQGSDLVLTSKVRPAKPLLGGNAVVGLTEKSNECPTIEDPVRTFHVDGSEIPTSIFTGLSRDKKQIALAFAKPMLAVLAIVLGLVLIRWLFTALFVVVRRVARQ